MIRRIAAATVTLVLVIGVIGLASAQGDPLRTVPREGPLRQSLAQIQAEVRTSEAAQPFRPRPRARMSVRQAAFVGMGVVAGLFGGGMLGAKIEGNRCHCDDPGLQGFIIGAPIGAVTGGIVGYILANR